MNITTNTEKIFTSFREGNVDDIGQLAQIANHFNKNDVYKLYMNLMSFFMPFQHIQNETVSDGIIINILSIIHVVNSWTSNLRIEAYS